MCSWIGYDEREDASISDLVGKKITDVEGLETGSDQIKITCDDGSVYVMCHDQDCCESVTVEDVVGDIVDLFGEVIEAREDSNSDLQPGQEDDPYNSFTWTFYNIYTYKGVVTIRWYGTSNGYYSEGVSFFKLKESSNVAAD